VKGFLKVLLILLIGLVLIAGCQSKEAVYKENMKLGKTAIETQEYDKAIDYYKEALGKKVTKEAKNSLSLSKDMKNLMEELGAKNYQGVVVMGNDILSSYKSSPHFEIIQPRVERFLDLGKSEVVKDQLKVTHSLIKKKKVEDAKVILDQIINENKENESLQQYVQEAEEMKKKTEKNVVDKKSENNDESKQDNHIDSSDESGSDNGTQMQKKEANVKDLTPAEAETLVKDEIMVSNNQNVKIQFDHENSQGLYVIKVYEVVIDNKDTNEGHTVTWGWYTVNPETKEILEMS
jgi:tetratricopeptide (TPR) repeat protein